MHKYNLNFVFFVFRFIEYRTQDSSAYHFTEAVLRFS
jgi:hypothetical protein